MVAIDAQVLLGAVMMRAFGNRIFPDSLFYRAKKQGS